MVVIEFVTGYWSLFDVASLKPVAIKSLIPIDYKDPIIDVKFCVKSNKIRVLTDANTIEIDDQMQAVTLKNISSDEKSTNADPILKDDGIYVSDIKLISGQFDSFCCLENRIVTINAPDTIRIHDEKGE